MLLLDALAIDFGSVSSPQSSFALDLTQTSRMLANHSPRSLCLLDEFGKGTAPVDGIALLAATVRFFVKCRGRVVFVLHFTEIIHDLILNPQDMSSIQCFKMETHKPRLTKKDSASGWSSEEADGIALSICVCFNVLNKYCRYSGK